MTYSEQMLRTHPRAAKAQFDLLTACIDACYDCAETCEACADACLGERGVKDLVDCVRLNLDCADVCGVTGKLVARQTGRNLDVVRAQLAACIEACRVCAAMCQRHAGKLEHCAVCAEACRRCEQACRALLAGSPAPSS